MYSSNFTYYNPPRVTFSYNGKINNYYDYGISNLSGKENVNKSIGSHKDYMS